MEQPPSKRLEELIRERARLDLELERHRRLVTILFVDIVGSTRFYDQHGDLAGLVMVQKCLDLLTPLIEEHGGIVVKTIGDAILARFDRSDTAVLCAVQMQRSLAERNTGRATMDQIHVRIAINLGLALLKENDMFGDVVNVASRIEGATEPDEIAISPSVYEQIRHLPNMRVRKKASGVELKGKEETLDLYGVVWRSEETAGPAPPSPSVGQLAMATGLPIHPEESAQRGTPGFVPAEPAVSSAAVPRSDKTAVLGVSEAAKSLTAGVRFVLALLRADGSFGEHYPLDRPGITAGQGGDIRLSDDPLVAPAHARFTQLGDAVFVEDLRSRQGVFLRLREPHCLRDGDVIIMGRERLSFCVEAGGVPAAEGVSLKATAIMGASLAEVARHPMLIRLNSENQETDRYRLRAPETSFGRSKGTYTFPEDHYLSATHARIELQDGQYFLEDLASTNGTFVRIRKRILIHEGDTLMIGQQLLRVLAEEASPPSH